jgi:glycyl-tRNA synthetase beta chain
MIRGRQSLIAANKRASNLLKQSEITTFDDVNSESLYEDEERQLFDAILETEVRLGGLLEDGDYPACLTELAGLREPVDRFFDKVMVMTDDEAVRRNRLALLDALRRQFAQIADVARLGR